MPILTHGEIAHKIGENNYGIGTLKFYDGSCVYVGDKYISSDDGNIDRGRDVSVNELKSKNIDYLYFSACNTGNVDTDMNIIKAFRNNNPTSIEVIGGWDGGVAFVPRYGSIAGFAIGGYVDKLTGGLATVNDLSRNLGQGDRQPLGYVEV